MYYFIYPNSNYEPYYWEQTQDLPITTYKLQRTLLQMFDIYTLFNVGGVPVQTLLKFMSFADNLAAVALIPGNQLFLVIQ